LLRPLLFCRPRAQDLLADLALIYGPSHFVVNMMKPPKDGRPPPVVTLAMAVQDAAELSADERDVRVWTLALLFLHA
jgi:hypothetical protein